MGGWFAAIIISMTGVVYFADTRMKTEDKSFSGFPGCWNMVVLVLFAIWPPVWISLTIIAILALAQFFGLKFVHPVRTARWRILSLPAMFLWVGAAFVVGWYNFEPAPLTKALLIASSGYLLFAGIIQQLLPQSKS